MTKINLNSWKQTFPKAQVIAKQAEQEVKAEAIKTLESLAQTWISEDKLIHAGAAQRLAKKLKAKPDE